MVAVNPCSSVVRYPAVNRAESSSSACSSSASSLEVDTRMVSVSWLAPGVGGRWPGVGDLREPAGDAGGRLGAGCALLGSPADMLGVWSPLRSGGTGSL